MRKLVLAFVMGLFMSAGAWAQDFQKGFDAHERGDYATALREFQPLVDQGDARAQFYLGGMRWNGWGIAQDYKEAARLYTLSAKQGHALGQLALGYTYLIGQGILQDDKEAFKWFALSAEQGNAAAQNNLALMYSLGRSVPKDDIRAHMWHNLAASNGDDKGASSRDLKELSMTPSQIKRAKDLARACLAKDYKGC